MLRSGDQIGPYTLINKLGRGAFGTVWLSERRTTITTTTAALKIPLDDDIDLETIKHEANLWVRASGHPNVLPIIEANIYDDHVVIASEYAPDGSLESLLKRHVGKAPSIEAAVEIISGILAGLEHLHSRSIIHRDLKPANILFQGNTPRLADFGISRVLKSTSQSSVVAGTPSYMAPEAFDGKRNEQTDIWSVGAILYQLLAGCLPFPQADITSLVGAILSRNPDPLPISVPKQLQEVIARALTKDPIHRYKSATEMRAALRNPSKPNLSVQHIVEPITATSAFLALPPNLARSQPVRKGSNSHIVYAVASLLTVLIVVVCITLLSRPKVQDASSPTSPSFSSEAHSQNLSGCSNLLQNGNFDSLFADWKVVNFTGGAITEIVRENGNAVVSMRHSGNNDWNSISQEIRSKLQTGRIYVFSFRYRSNDNVKIGIRFGDSSAVMHSTGINREYWEHVLIADGNWHTDAFEFTVTNDHPRADEPMFGAFFDYNNTGSIFIDEVIVAEKRSDCHVQ
jgi:serine/threonine protein kinase